MKLLILALTVAAWITMATALQMPCAVTFSLLNYTRDGREIPDLDLTVDPGEFAGTFTKHGGEAQAGWYKWPRSKSTKLANIPYCYRTDFERDLFAEVVEDAIQTWYTALGGPPSQWSGHGINFKERLNGCGDPLYCEDHGSWNKDVPLKTVMIQASQSGGYSASAGYHRQNPPKPYENILTLARDDPDVRDVTHELGHIMGLLHEHQRQDRDDHVIYRCEKLPDLAAALQKAQQKDPTITQDDLCHNLEKALLHNFIGKNFIKFRAEDYDVEGTPYDIDSIMHYPTGDGHSMHASSACLAGNIAECSLVKKRYPGDTEGQRILYPVVPSDADVAFLKSMYPHRL